MFLGEFLAQTPHSSESRIKSLFHAIRSLMPPHKSPKLYLSKSLSGGIGMFTSQHLKPGEYILIEHPVVSVLDIEAASSKFSDLDGSDSIAVIERIASSYSPELDSCIRSLYPVRDSVSSHVSLSGFPRTLLEHLANVLPTDIQAESVVRAIQLNSLGFYTFPELSSFSDHLRYLTGTGIYKSASMFNHSCEPNVNHFSVGDVAIFCANKSVDAGEELFISYIGTDILRESKSIRDEFLEGRDFNCACPKCSVSENEADPWLEELDLRTRASISIQTNSEKRVSYIRNLLNVKQLIFRDRKDILFTLCRELGNSGRPEWARLLTETRGCSDFFTVVVRIHYMVYCGKDEELLRDAQELSKVALGESCDSLEDVRNLLAITDFPPSSGFRHNFENLWFKKNSS